ncbi:MAG: hypothetical protein ACKOIZ_05150, partial [Actinomycetota bacterium]
MTIPTAERPTAAPPVVAVMVVHEPGDWFAEVLRGLAEQDYPDIRLVALVTSTTPPGVADHVRSTHPAAHLRTVEGNQTNIAIFQLGKAAQHHGEPENG